MEEVTQPSGGAAEIEQPAVWEYANPQQVTELLDELGLTERDVRVEYEQIDEQTWESLQALPYERWGWAAIEVALQTLISVAPRKPVWDRDTRQLKVSDAVVKDFRKTSANNQTKVFEAFEEAGWPQSIPNPLNGGAGQLQQTVKDINRNLQANLIHFKTLAGGIVAWELRQAPADE